MIVLRLLGYAAISGVMLGAAIAIILAAAYWYVTHEGCIKTTQHDHTTD